MARIGCDGPFFSPFDQKVIACQQIERSIPAHLDLMEAKDGSFGFDFGGVYDKVVLHKEISYTLGDGRKATTLFTEQNGKTHIATTFDAETQNDPEFQKQG